MLSILAKISWSNQGSIKRTDLRLGVASLADMPSAILPRHINVSMIRSIPAMSSRKVRAT